MSFNPSDNSLYDPSVRKGAFREAASDIVWKDRELRKHGRSVDTGGAIVRALENAYKLGLAHSSAKTLEKVAVLPDEDSPLPWTTIPKRARDAMSMICSFQWVVLLHKNSAPWKANPDQWGCYTDRGEQFKGGDRLQFECAYSVSTLASLVKLNLMSIEYPKEGLTMLVLTKRGLKTFHEAVKKGRAFST